MLDDFALVCFAPFLRRGSTLPSGKGWRLNHFRLTYGGQYEAGAFGYGGGGMHE